MILKKCQKVDEEPPSDQLFELEREIKKLKNYDHGRLSLPFNTFFSHDYFFKL